MSKGPKTTTWIWNLHSDAHDFDMEESYTSWLITRKVFASNLAHLSLVLFWISGMHFHGAYFSNYDVWLKDPTHSSPSAHLVWCTMGEDILNSDIGNYFQGIDITSGIFQLWRSQGIITLLHLKYAIPASVLGGVLCLAGSYFHINAWWSVSLSSVDMRLRSLSKDHLALGIGLSCISWCAHQIHISETTQSFLDSGIDPALIPCPQDLFIKISMAIASPSTAAPFLALLSTHHFYLGIVFVAGALISFPTTSYPSDRAKLRNSLDLILSVKLVITGSLSFGMAWRTKSPCIPIAIYPYFASDYPTVLCGFVHHMWLGALLIIGAGAHASITIIRDYAPLRLSKPPIPVQLLAGSCRGDKIEEVLNHRHLILGHLIWISLALGLHAFSVYIHNDSLQAFRQPEGMFRDQCIILKPVFGALLQRPGFGSSNIKILDKILYSLSQELATADFVVHHIHAFTIHLCLLILLKAILYARSSRLVSDKLELGFRYPCDGPGRGGTCQISAWDHIYLAAFWIYNSVSVGVFHYFWKMESDVWGSSYLPEKIYHITPSDFSLNSTSINGWLRNFLWSEAAEVIQSYALFVSLYGLIFISSHFIWALSLMFLYSGRGYWQELIESILAAHHKLKIVPHIQPHALSISQGRAVALIHYLLGGIGCTWCFFISRMVVLST